MRQISLHCDTCARTVLVRPYRSGTSVTPWSLTMLQHFYCWCSLFTDPYPWRASKCPWNLLSTRLPQPTAAVATAAVVLPPSILRSHIIFSRPNNVAFENHLLPAACCWPRRSIVSKQLSDIASDDAERQIMNTCANHANLSATTQYDTFLA